MKELARCVENYSRKVWKTSGKSLLHGSLGRYLRAQVFPKYVSTLAHEVCAVDRSHKTCVQVPDKSCQLNRSMQHHLIS